MKCLCKRTCQTRIGDKIRYVRKGEVLNLPECPVHFVPLDNHKVDFLKASEAELMEAKWKFDEAYEAIHAAFGVELTREEGTKKSDVVAQILDARFRAVD